MNKFKFGKYRETDAMFRLISDHYPALGILSRFGIALGFGDQNIGEVCRNHQVDPATFLSIVNLMVSDNHPDLSEDNPPISVSALIDYLRSSHSYFLDYRLPLVRRQLTEVLDEKQAELNQAVLEYFDVFAAAVRKHMLFENNKVFPSVTDNQQKAQYPDRFRKQHEQIETGLTEFKNILIKYYPAPATNEMNTVLLAIFHCEQELIFHNAIEDQLFLPAIR
jgi:regulator of cell morphogenesis and NO signaling